MSVEIKPVGNWQKQIEDPLKLALAASTEICGRTLAEACKHAIILMAQTARRLTPKAPLKRPIMADIRTRSEFIEVYKKDGSKSRLFKFNFASKKGPAVGTIMKGTWEQAQRIKNRGLAQRSWMWGLRALGTPGQGRPIPGVSYLKTISTATHGGYILFDALKYLLKILPAGWNAIVAQKAANKIMHQAKMKLERQWKAEMGRSFRTGKSITGGIGKYFLRV